MYHWIAFFSSIATYIGVSLGKVVLWFHKTKSHICLQREFPDMKTTNKWNEKFYEAGGSVGDLRRSGRPSVNEENVNEPR